jgi:hypothetical protein
MGTKLHSGKAVKNMVEKGERSGGSSAALMKRIERAVESKQQTRRDETDLLPH